MYTPVLAGNNNYTSGVKHKGFVRFLFVLSIVAFIFTFTALVSVYASGDSEPGKAGLSGTQRTVVVEQGDTLWAIAGSYKQSGQDIRSYVDSMKKANGLKSSVLKEGQILIVP